MPTPEGSTSDQRFQRSQRLRRQSDFDRVFDSTAFAADEWLVVRGCRNGLPFSRLGVSVSRKVGNAVLRNRWKRLLREAFRQNQSVLPQGLDLVARPRRGARPEFQGVSVSLPRLTRRIAQSLRTHCP